MSDEVPPTGSEAVTEHPLEHNWVLWYDSRKLQNAGPDWFGNLQRISEMTTVENFWSTYNHVKRPSELEISANYHFFKEGIKPMWEDPANAKGGKWTISLSAAKESGRMDELWERLLLSLIGESLENENVITGAVLARRKPGNCRIHIWIRETAQATVDEVKESLLGTMDMRDAESSFVFAAHSQ